VTSCIVDSAAIYIMVVKFRNTICPPSPQLSLHRRSALASDSNGTRSYIAERTQSVVYIVRCLWDTVGFNFFFANTASETTVHRTTLPQSNLPSNGCSKSGLLQYNERRGQCWQTKWREQILSCTVCMAIRDISSREADVKWTLVSRDFRQSP
jgi:hypothetical protein